MTTPTSSSPWAASRPPPPAAWRDLRPSRPALVQPLLAIAQIVRYRRAPEDENRDNVERAARGH